MLKEALGVFTNAWRISAYDQLNGINNKQKQILSHLGNKAEAIE